MHQWFLNRKILILVAASVLILLLLIKLVLYLNLMIGNDVGISLSAERTDVRLVRGESERLEFEAHVSANPFCTVSCTSGFEDVSTNTTLSTQRFSMKKGLPHAESHTITATKSGEGQELYRLVIECESTKTMLCHTEAVSVKQTALITMEYNRSQEEREIRANLRDDIEAHARNIGEVSGRIKGVNATLLRMQQFLVVTNEQRNALDAARVTGTQMDALDSFEKLWQNEDYETLVAQMAEARQQTDTTLTRIEELEQMLKRKAGEVNSAAAALTESGQMLNQIRSLFITDADIAGELNDSIREYNLATHRFIQPSDTKEYHTTYDALFEKARQSQDDNALLDAVTADLWYRLFCRLNLSCVDRPTMRERIRQRTFDPMESCSDIERVRSQFSPDLNASDPWKAMMIDELQRLPNARASDLIRERFENSTPQQPESCKPFYTTTINAFFFEPISIEEARTVTITLNLTDPEPQCCVFGLCASCCDEACRIDPKTFPIVFIHGHAVSKDTSFDYSMDAFTWLQSRLETDGFIDAGSIALYSDQQVPSGSWGIARSPITIRASYYFDLYEASDDTLIVQTKSENIDTYAVRLNELIKTVRQNTGKPRVILIAHSMGGLVARRYVQVFGKNDVEKLIMIGTPNHGINGTISRMCPVTGGELECRDMDADSLFMNKLNKVSMSGLETVNIVGTGCRMDGGDGDGIILADSARLGRSNVMVNGTCDSQYLHSKLLRDDAVYRIIRKSLMG
jgi:hypothetical protein